MSKVHSERTLAAMSLTANDLRALGSKYAEMLRLRLADADGSLPDPQRAMAALAARFPGALREIDELPLDTIRSRIASLKKAADDPERAQPWMKAAWRFHALARGALWAKRWLGRRREVTPELHRSYENACASLAEPDEARDWAAELAHVARPPRGRLMNLVFERLARELEVEPAEARLLVFGPPRRKPPQGAPKATPS